MKKVINSIQISAKEWFDRVNGNSYFSSRIYVERGGIYDVLYVPFSYGYGNMYEQDSLGVLLPFLIEEGYIKTAEDWREFKKTLSFMSYIQTGCKKKEVINWGDK